MTLQLRDLIETTRHSLAGFDASQEAVLELASTVNSSVLSLPVDDIAEAVPGFVEIDLEVIRIKSVDSSAVALVATTAGRGQRATTATSHTAGAEVLVNPSWPASTVAREINGVLTEIYPQVYAVKSFETTVPVDGGALTVPSDASGIIACYVADEVRPGQWLREDRWAWQPDSTSTHKGLRVGGRYRAGLGVRVVYSASPTPFDLTGALTQDFVTTTGLPERIADLVRLGVAVRMAPYFDLARLPSTAAVARFDGDSRGPSAGANAVRILDALYQRRLTAESNLLFKQHPIHLHFTGRV